MLSYRHVFHAGNHADVLKHACLTLLLEKLIEKDKPLTYIDTHAAAGGFDLNSEMARKNREFASGVDKLLTLPSASPLLATYLDLASRCRQGNRYPGSPAVAAEILRATDKLVLMELHNTEFLHLKDNMRHDRRVTLHHRDGIEGALALCPPTPRRGVILIDPPYEQSLEYSRIAQMVAQLHKKWPVGIVALWYPLLARDRDRSSAMLDSLAKARPANLFTAELWVEAQAEDYGMYGSGMAFINLPWQLDEQIGQLLPVLHAALAETQGGYRCDWRISPH